MFILRQHKFAEKHTSFDVALFFDDRQCQAAEKGCLTCMLPAT
jgi:hypothetical protein